MRSFRPFHSDGGPARFAHRDGSGGYLAYPADPDCTGDGGVTGTARETLYLGNIDLIIDRLQELFDQWEAQQTFSPAITADVMCRARLAVHEWVANLVQHADFRDRVPEIALSLWAHGERLCCVIADNSEGFEPDLQPRVTLEEVCRTLPERGMGLLLLQACAHHVRYCSLGTQGHRLEFTVA